MRIWMQPKIIHEAGVAKFTNDSDGLSAPNLCWASVRAIAATPAQGQHTKLHRGIRFIPQPLDWEYIFNKGKAQSF